MKKIVCFHLLNDFSGSPKVLKMVLEGLLKRGLTLDLVTTRGGVLDALAENPACRMHSYRYSFSTRPIVEILRYGWIQFYTFCLAFRWLFAKDVMFYINTLLPVGPALAGKLMGKRVVYHYHENADAKSGIYRVLCSMMQRLADEIICVSEYQRSFLKRKEGVHVVPNSLPEEFVAKLHPDVEAAFDRKNVLMIGSLKAYKSVKEFVALANQLPQYQFTLVFNDELPAIDKFLAEQKLKKGDNLHIVPRQQDVTSFYNQASVVLNLTNREMAIETFGLTALEAMSAALPVIVPTVGGIAEMVEDGVNGYKIDVQELDKIAEKIQEILTNKELYCLLSQNALKHSKGYNAEFMIEKIINVAI